MIIVRKQLYIKKSSLEDRIPQNVEPQAMIRRMIMIIIVSLLLEIQMSVPLLNLSQIQKHEFLQILHSKVRIH